MQLMARILNSIACGICLFAILKGYTSGALLLLTLHAGSLACIRSLFDNRAKKFFVSANLFFLVFCCIALFVLLFENYPAFFLPEQPLTALAITLFSALPMTLNAILIRESVSD